jgi:SAM-dependent methyltransferase
MDATREILAEQLCYYRDGAEQYDEANRSLLVAQDDDGRSRRAGRRAALRALVSGRGHSVLELAGGTGLYTEPLARLARRLTVVDASPEGLALNRRRTAHLGTVTFVEADIFDWQPRERYDVVVFAFWLSHVPQSLFAPFWSLVDACLVEAGTVVVIDARAPASDSPATGKASFFSEDQLVGSVSVRYLADGAAHRIVRVLWDPDELAAKLGALGWEAVFDDSHWLVGRVSRAANPQG